ncbi:hypothetical protein B2_gp70 [Shigella phage B2]|nr:hypothetical protein B2_gp70 [Shigella phage B2]
MNNDLFLILSSIKAALGEGRGKNTSADFLCNGIHDTDPEQCHYVNCIDCIVGYKDSTKYAHQIIQTWKIL